MRAAGDGMQHVDGGPELDGVPREGVPEAFGHCPVQRGDGWGEKAQGFQLADSGEEATGRCGGLMLLHEEEEGIGDGLSMGEVGVRSMVYGQGSEVGKVGVCGARGPGPDGSSQGIGVWRAGFDLIKLLA